VQRRDLANAFVIGIYPGPLETGMVKDMLAGKALPSQDAAVIVMALEDVESRTYS
jgi:hypothetical protein